MCGNRLPANAPPDNRGVPSGLLEQVANAQRRVLAVGLERSDRFWLRQKKGQRKCLEWSFRILVCSKRNSSALETLYAPAEKTPQLSSRSNENALDRIAYR